MRYGLVSDIHSNLAALDAALEGIQELGSVDGLLCMGDIVGYGPQPNEVIKRLKDFKLFSIVGNHDLAVLGKLDLNDFNYDAIQANRWNREKLTEENREWLEQLEPMQRFDDKVVLAHGSPLEPIWEYLTTPQAASRSFSKFDTQCCFVGHTHLPRIFRLKGGFSAEGNGSSKITISRLLKTTYHTRTDMIVPQPGEVFELKNDRIIINPGSVGQPRDGDSRASFAVYDDEAMTVTFGRVAYDISLTQHLMREANLPARLILRLDYGL
jgi:diadenosine tetraphosphatase ApaH/serine/threonine PP2A family protein phosphatase